jgi:protein-tyrosine phosphatase
LFVAEDHIDSVDDARGQIQAWESVIDLHCHVLPGIDDGPETVETALAMARAASADGVQTIVATPHVNWVYRSDAATIADSVADLNRRLARQTCDVRSEGAGATQASATGGSIDPPLSIRAGAEIAVTRIADIEPSELARLGLGGSPWLLVEPPMSSTAKGMEVVVAELHRRGHRVLLAHPERCLGFHRDRRLLESLLAEGALTSLTARSFTGRFGETVRRFAVAMLDAGMVHTVASDAHDLAGRPPGLAAVLDQAGLAPLADWLTRQVPNAILRGADIPRQPHIPFQAVAVPGRWWRRARRVREAGSKRA